MRVNAQVVSGLGRILIILLALAAVSSSALAADPDLDEPLAQIEADTSPAVGWTKTEEATIPTAGPGRDLGLAWDSESVLEFRGIDGTMAVARLNVGHVIPGDMIMEYLICTHELDESRTSHVYGQVSYTGWDSAGVRLLEWCYNVPQVSNQGSSLASPSDIDWAGLRRFMDTCVAVRRVAYAFPLEHQSIAFGPTGHLGLSIAMRRIDEARTIVEPRLASTMASEMPNSSPEETKDAAPTQPESDAGSAEGSVSDVAKEPVSDAAEGSVADLTGEIDAAATQEEGSAGPTAFSTPEDTARYFLEAVMVDRDPDKAAQAWSPRIPDVVIRAVVENEIEFFSDRDTALLNSILSSLAYVTEHVSDSEAIVSIVEYDDQAVVGRLELSEGEWLLIALAYQLDSDLSLSAEWKRLAGIE